MAPVLQIGEANVEQGKKFDQSDQTQQGSKEQPHPANCLAVDNVKDVLGDVELQLGPWPALDPPDVQTNDYKNLREEVQHSQPIKLHAHRRLPADFPCTGASILQEDRIVTSLLALCLIISTPRKTIYDKYT